MASKKPKFNGLSDDQVLMLLGQIATSVNLMADICHRSTQRHALGGAA